MFADAGAKPPPGMGTGTPEQVGAAVVKAIERDKVEIAVGPDCSSGSLSHFALASPGIAVRVAERRRRARRRPKRSPTAIRGQALSGRARRCRGAAS